MKIDTHFIEQNKAPYNTKRIGIFTDTGKKLGYIPLGNLALPSDLGVKLYSFGALSDIHLYDGDADNDFQTALRYLTNIEKVDFICICDRINVAKFCYWR
jgi:hypothetical protein